ncbi:cell wall-binding repeat-containing protein [Streptantibioticus silvisoli]|uniref:Cell wall-binding repeat-containing protein n=1 Tax=Streptantibioticus silvisoli TaxID=2705255 RepID=A0ABT6W2Z9_9ACTN|nr:cell wall-binding repeat-containing protein [Streptantibioticus silvisoli]MDI5965112.1 cell wall-binding repeat-containing protein [Streptantibioticus silvisoli]
MNSSTRRTSAALSVAIAVAAGTVLAALPSSAYAGSTSAGTVIASSGTSGTVTEVTAAGATVRTLTGSGTQPAWSPTGARLVSITGNSVVTQRYDGSGLHTVHTTAASTGAPTGPAFAFGGRSVVYTAAGKLQIAPADGATGPQNLLSAAQMSSGNCDTQASASAGGDSVYFTRSSGGCGHNLSVWRYDEQTYDVSQVIAAGSDAVQSQAGDQLVYTGSDGQAYLADSDGGNAQQLTSDGRTYGSYTWAPDGGTVLAVATSGSTHTEVSIDLTASTPTVTDVGRSAGYLAWQPDNAVHAGRVYGSSAAATNIAASRWNWNTAGQSAPGLQTADSAVLVASGDQTDAGLVPALAAKKNGPALMTTATSLDSAVQAELQRVLPQGRTVYLVGGTSVLSSAVSTKVTSLGYKAVRISGSSRYVTSVDIAKATASAPGYVFLATGGDYHSILEAEAAAGSAGADSNATAVYTDGSTMTASVYQYLDSLSPSTVLIPIGSASTALAGAVRAGHLSNWGSTVYAYPVSGSGNTGTSVALARMWWAGGPYTATFVDDDNWHDGLDGYSSMAGWGPVMWVTPTAADAVDETYLKDESASVQDIVTFSGTSNVTTNAFDGLANSLAVSGNWVYDTFLNGASATPIKPARTPEAFTTRRAATAASHGGTAGPQAHALGSPVGIVR